MEGKDAIIQKIIGDANAQAESLLAEANTFAETLLKEAKEAGKAEIAAARKQSEADGSEYISRRMTVCELDLKKQRLAAKKQVLDDVFDRAFKKALELKPAVYKRVIEGMLDAGAEDGDTVTVSAADAKVVTEAFIADFAKKKGIKLSLDKKYGDFSGGFILHGNGVDKNLTFAVEFKILREEFEAEVAAVIFGEVK